MNKTLRAIENLVEKFIFLSRWIQLPVYLGLIVATIAYTFHFSKELIHLVSHMNGITSMVILAGVLELIDVSMVINLLIVVIIGGYSTFVSKLDLSHSVDRPDWLEKVNAGTLKIKLIVSLVSISGVHLLQSFINIKNVDKEEVWIQMAIHGLFLISAVMLSWADQIMDKGHSKEKQ